MLGIIQPSNESFGIRVFHSSVSGFVLNQSWKHLVRRPREESWSEASGVVSFSTKFGNTSGDIFTKRVGPKLRDEFLNLLSVFWNENYEEGNL